MEMRLPSDFREFLTLLGSNGVRYLLIGGYAVGYHGYPRASRGDGAPGAREGVLFAVDDRLSAQRETGAFRLPCLVHGRLKTEGGQVGRQVVATVPSWLQPYSRKYVCTPYPLNA